VLYGHDSFGGNWQKISGTYQKDLCMLAVRSRPFHYLCWDRPKNYLFMGSIGGGKAAAIAYTLVETAK
jgi:hypothetical protein